MIDLLLLVFRTGDGADTSAGKSQQLYEPVDLHGVQRSLASSSDAVLSQQAAGALSDWKVVVGGNVMCDH